MFYLRKTPQDLIIEEIMLEKRCTQDRAEQIYLRQLEQNKKLKTPTEQSPEQQKSHLTQNLGIDGLKSIYDNIIHARSPSRGGDLRVNHV